MTRGLKATRGYQQLQERLRKAQARRAQLRAQNIRLRLEHDRALMKADRLAWEVDIMRDANRTLVVQLLALEQTVRAVLAAGKGKGDTWRLLVLEEDGPWGTRLAWHCTLCDAVYAPPLQYEWAVQACPHPGAPKAWKVGRQPALQPLVERDQLMMVRRRMYDVGIDKEIRSRMVH